ncbi:hypothetical protein LX32DRAFT_289387 [Colletotrichum zoysiae]|uniref:Uncharacterized protein n=1 Tax=Colletotrichum zoysiae TaxID=1216348 RepID=A0AAD9H1T1_9PEZI|nr:hypothetical protein LX32DRAFT_289387 [Colletotrichum zoysiae]
MPTELRSPMGSGTLLASLAYLRILSSTRCCTPAIRFRQRYEPPRRARQHYVYPILPAVWSLSRGWRVDAPYPKRNLSRFPRLVLGFEKQTLGRIKNLADMDVGH